MNVDLHARLRTYLDGGASPELLADLDASLRQDPDLRKELLVLSGFDAEMPAALREIVREESVAPVKPVNPDVAGAPPADPHRGSGPVHPVFRWNSGWILWPAAAAATAVLAFKVLAPAPKQAEQALARAEAPRTAAARPAEPPPPAARETPAPAAATFHVRAIPAGPAEGDRAVESAPMSSPAVAGDASVRPRPRPPVPAMRAMRTPLELEESPQAAGAQPQMAEAPAPRTVRAAPRAMAMRTPLELEEPAAMRVAPAAMSARGDMQAGERATPPPPPDAPRLAALPRGPAADWPAQRAALKARWQTLLGTFPDPRPPLKPVVVATETLSNCTRTLVRYPVEEGVEVDGYLLVPAGAPGPLPAVVVFHPTTPLHARGVAGVNAEYAEEKRQGLHLAARGYVAWCPRNYIYADGAGMSGNVARVKARHPDWSGMGRMVWDAIRAVDFLETLPEVDRRRIGCLGHSLGGKEVLYAMAFDERYRAGVSSEGGIGLTFSNWDAPWYLGPAIREPGFDLENHQVLSLVAPRPFLLLAGESADGDRSRAFLDAVRPVYEMLGAAGNLEWLNHRQGHAYPPAARAAAEAFLDRRLGRNDPVEDRVRTAREMDRSGRGK
jgi:dienelactone hydrolase